jgi:radical SAM protein with 4Fe4S-binding SPASM domain
MARAFARTGSHVISKVLLKIAHVMTMMKRFAAARACYIKAHELTYGHDRPLQAPTVVSVETIMGCNAACIMCPYSSSPREKGLMKDDLFERIVDQILDLPTQPRVSLQFLGEPLMDKKLESRISYLRQHNIEKIEIATNASLLTTERTRELLQSGLDLINVDLESLHKEVYESIRIGLRHEVVMRNIDNLFKIRDDMESRTSISILFIESEKNKGEIHDFIDYFSDIVRPEKGDYIRIFAMHNFGGHCETLLKPSNQACYSIYTAFSVLKDGSVPLCCVDENADVKMGDIKEQSISEIFNGIQYSKMRRLHEMGGRAAIEKCSTCNLPEVVSHQIIYGHGGEPMPKRPSRPPNLKAEIRAFRKVDIR